MVTRWSCLDFTTTVGWEARDRADDAFVDYGALLAWGEQAGLVSAPEAAALRAVAAAQPLQAERVLRRALELRRLIYAVFSAIGSGRAPAAGDVAGLNGHVSESLGQLEVRPKAGGFGWGWRTAAGEVGLRRVLWPIARSAAELLTSPELARVKVCEADDCGWLFVDASRNRSRRWCDMSDCGNLAKVRRFRARRRKGG